MPYNYLWGISEKNEQIKEIKLYNTLPKKIKKIYQ